MAPAKIAAASISGRFALDVRCNNSITVSCRCHIYGIFMKFRDLLEQIVDMHAQCALRQNHAFLPME